MHMSKLVALMSATALLLVACGAPAPAAAPAAVPDAAAVATTVPTEEVQEEMAGEEMSEAVAETDSAEAAAGEEAMAEEAMAEEPVAEETMAEETMAEETMAEETMAEEPVAEETMAEETMAEEVPMVERPTWQQIALVDARTGASFTLADYAGKTVFVEPFATWCFNCRKQLQNVAAAKPQLGDDVVFITLSVEPNIGADVLARYADDGGFDWTFAAMPPEMLQELAAVFGQTVSNPPATPHFIIRADGSYTELETGIKDANAVVEQVRAAQS